MVDVSTQSQDIDRSRKCENVGMSCLSFLYFVTFIPLTKYAKKLLTVIMSVSMSAFLLVALIFKGKHKCMLFGFL